MQWTCASCGTENGPEAAYCVECAEAGPAIQEAEAPSDGSTGATLVHTGGESRSTLVGTSAGIAPSLLGRSSDPALTQPLPRKVRVSMAGWTALVGGWPELFICLVTLPLVAIGVFAGGMMLGGLASAILGMGGVALFVILAFLYGAPETFRTLKGYRLAREGWAAGGEITRKFNRKGRLGSTYLVEYSYTDARGVIRRSTQEVTQEQWQSTSIHDTITVLYDPDKPESCVVYELLGVVAVAPPHPALAAGEEVENQDHQ